MILFLVSLVLYVLLSTSVIIKRYGVKVGRQTLLMTGGFLVFLFAFAVLISLVGGREISNSASYLAIALGLFNRLFLPHLWISMDKNEQSDFARHTWVETWYFDEKSSYWLRRDEIVSLMDWVTFRGKDLSVFDLATLKEYGKKYHWIYIESSPELPKPYTAHSAMMHGRMYQAHRLGPYSKSDNV